MGASDLTIHNKQHKISPSASLPPQRRANKTRWPTFCEKSTEVGVKNGKQRITQITCHCLFSLKKRQSVGFSGVPLFSCCSRRFSSSRAPPSVPLSISSGDQSRAAAGTWIFQVSRAAAFRATCVTPNRVQPLAITPSPAGPREPGDTSHGHLSQRKTLLFLPKARVRQKEIFLIRDKNKCI